MQSEDRSIAAVEAYFHQQGWTYEHVERTALVAPVETAQGRLLCIVDVQAQRLLFESLYSFIIPQSRRMLVAEFAVRANRRIDAGALTVDVDDGDVGLRTGIALGVFEWDARLVGHVVQRHLDTSDRLLPGIVAVCFTNATPRQALDACLVSAAPRDIFAQVSELLTDDEDAL